MVITTIAIAIMATITINRTGVDSIEEVEEVEEEWEEVVGEASEVEVIRAGM